MANSDVRERSDTAKQEDLDKYFLKPSRFNDGEDDESEIESEVTETSL